MRTILVLFFLFATVPAIIAQNESPTGGRRSTTVPRGGEQPSAGPVDLSVIVTDNGFQPMVMRIPPGASVRVRLQNSGRSPHGLKVKIGKQEFGTNEAVAPGQKTEFTFTAPTGNGGMGEFYSPVPADQGNRAFRGRVLPGSPWGEGG
jgi:plastocyanin